MSFRSEEERPDQQEPAADAVDDKVARREGRRRRRTPLGFWLLLFTAVLLVVALVAGAIFLWRSLGERVSATSVYEDSIDAGSEPRIRLVNGAGQIQVTGEEGLGEVGLEVIKHAQGPDPAAAKQRASEVPVDISREEGVFVIKTDGGGDTGADYVLRVPSASTLEVESEAGDVEVSGLSGEVTARAGAGDVTVQDVRGSVTLEVPQGDVNLERMGTDAGQAKVEVGTGDAEFTNLLVGTLEANVEAGDVSLSGRFSGGGRVFVRTGDIIADLPPEDTRELSLEALIGEVMRGGEGEER